MSGSGASSPAAMVESSDTAKLALLVPHLDSIRIPNETDKIYKDECIYSFDTPDSADGIFVCMRSFLGFSKRFTQLYHSKSGNAIFLNMRRIAHEAKSGPPVGTSSLSSTDRDEEIKRAKITKLAINVEGGFQTADQKIEYEEVNSIVLMPDFVQIPLSLPDLPEKLVMCVSAILSADSAARKAELDAMQNTWHGEKRTISRHAESLVQLDNGVQVPPCGWKCANCDKRDGLWLNLTDGSILCGRRYFDGTGGNNHAELHYKATQYPLVVKLGTITSSGADVYSYAEDNMVEDPKLAQHLAHFGINTSAMQKTEKSMLEMEIDLNQRYDEWSIIQEDGCALRSLFGPGFTGLTNLGNSCYLNSVMQVLFTIPDFITEFYRPDKVQQFEESYCTNPAGDLRAQLVKLATGLLSGEYSKPCPLLSGKEQVGIKPRMFKTLIGRNHSEFGSKRQQDAQEFFLHVIDAIERLGGWSTVPPTDCFKFQVEERMQCGKSGKVRYTTRSDFLLSLPIGDVPVQNKQEYEQFLKNKQMVEQAGGNIEPEQVVRPIVKMTECIRAFAQDTIVDDFFSPAVNGKTFAKLRTRLKTFPDYLLLHMKKFTLDADWTPKKLDVQLEVPDVLQLDDLRATGKQANEELLPEEGDSSTPASGPSIPTPEHLSESKLELLKQLCDMGFSEDACRRALWHTKYAGVEPGLNWILEHMEDADFNAPFAPPNQSAKASVPAPTVSIDAETLQSITTMGIEERHARLALKLNNNNIQQAIEWIFSNMANMDQIEREEEQRARAASVAAANCAQVFRDGKGTYQLVAMISHMGQSTLCGHYVAHIRKRIGAQVTVSEQANTTTSITTQDSSKQETQAQPPITSAPNENADQHRDKIDWTIFNDHKVAISEKPPVQFAYLYLYKRLDANGSAQSESAAFSGPVLAASQ